MQRIDAMSVINFLPICTPNADKRSKVCQLLYLRYRFLHDTELLFVEQYTMRNLQRLRVWHIPDSALHCHLERCLHELRNM